MIPQGNASAIFIKINTKTSSVQAAPIFSVQKKIKS